MISLQFVDWLDFVWFLGTIFVKTYMQILKVPKNN